MAQRVWVEAAQPVKGLKATGIGHVQVVERVARGYSGDRVVLEDGFHLHLGVRPEDL